MDEHIEMKDRCIHHLDAGNRCKNCGGSYDYCKNNPRPHGYRREKK